jgi:hypothetical protein
MQSIFSPAARRKILRGGTDGGRRDGGLKMDWTKPGRFGRAIALCVLNGIDLFCFGDPSADLLTVGVPRG